MTIDLSAYQRIVVLTGAGVSAASGLPTYRGAKGEQDRDVAHDGHMDRLQDDPGSPWALFGPLRAQLATAEPNAAHYVLAAIEHRMTPSQSFTLITQNIDGLHQQAGSRNVIELHGNVHMSACTNGDCSLEAFFDEDVPDTDIPPCPRCNHPLRPHVVLFGEPIPAKRDWLSKQVLRDCDLFIAIGTSGSVYPAANFVRSTQYAGARTVYVNLEPLVPDNPAYGESYLGKAEVLLPELFGIPLADITDCRPGEPCRNTPLRHTR